MESLQPADTFGNILWNLVLITAGSVVCAVSVNAILIPHDFLAGGFSGLALMVHYLFPSLSVGWAYFLLNTPLYLVGWLHVGRRFFVYSIAGLVAYSLAVMWVHVPLNVEDRILAALLGGILMGGGSGIILRSRGSAGGTDILSIWMLKRFSVRIGTTLLTFNAVLLTVISFWFTVEKALYALIFIFVSSNVINLVVTGLSQRKAVMIISPRWQDISAEIMERLHRGVTAFDGQGLYTGAGQKILYTVVTFQNLPRLKEIVRRHDPGAFVVVSDTLEVMGPVIGNQPH